MSANTQNLTATELLSKWAGEHPEETVFTTSFGAEDQVITHLICSLGLPIAIETLDTGRLFPETYELWAETEKRYGIRIRAYAPDAAELEALVQERGIACYRDSLESRHACCAVRKLGPLARLLRGRRVWVTGLRREQSVTRSTLQQVETDASRGGIIKLAPLADWSEFDVWNFIRAHEVPYNVLHDRSFPSIGCACCTRAVKRIESVRAGRWWWEPHEHRECGLHNRPRQ